VQKSFFIDPELQSKLCPVALAPIAAEKPWGVVAHASWGFPAQADALKGGEIWLACDDFGLESKVAGGPHAGRTLGWLLANWERGLVGYRAQPDAPALTISLRIERTGAVPGPARVLDQEELWFALEAGAESWAAFSGPGPWPKSLRKTQLEAADALLVPPGLVRCQGPKLTILKAIPTGTLVKTVYDWDRPADPWDFTPPPRDVPAAEGEPEPLKPASSENSRARLLYQGPHYELTLVKTGFATGRGDGLSIICPITGRGRINASGVTETLRLHPGQACLVPAAQSRWSVESGTLLTYLHFRLY
jgi:mannose-6-phosphate isomerase class I